MSVGALLIIKHLSYPILSYPVKGGNYFRGGGGLLTEVFELFSKNSSYVRGVSVCIFVALYVRMFVAGANEVEGTMS